MPYADFLNDNPEFFDRLEKGLDRVHTIYDFLQAQGLFDGARTLLSIGAGTGQVELRAAKERGTAIGVIEPAGLYYVRFLRNVDAMGLQEQVLESHLQRFEDYEPGRRYDLVLSLYSWFAFDTQLDMLRKALDCRQPGGVLAIVLPSATCFGPLVHQFCSPNPQMSLTAEGLSAYLQTQGIAHGYEVFSAAVPVGTYLDGRELNQGGRDFVSFLATTPWEEIPEQARHLARLMMLACVRGDRIAITSGCLVFRDGGATPPA